MRFDESLFSMSAANDAIQSASMLANGESDCEVLDVWALCDRCMGNLQLVQRVLDKFETRLPGELAELERVLENDDAAKIALVAHRIKGNSSNVSATGLRHAAAEIEDLSRAGRVADARAHLDGLQDQWRRYVDNRDELHASIAGSAARAPMASTRIVANSGVKA
jgi:HPt (histidine-containing phosphotransfer) domain-containing protein